MTLGNILRITIFGESHGRGVGGLVQGLPANIKVDEMRITSRLAQRRPGSNLHSSRSESDECEIMSGVHQGRTTGWPILLWIENRDARSRDYSFLPDLPRPGHADLPAMIRSEGAADPRGGGSHSARLTAPLVAAAALCAPLLEEAGISVVSHVSSIGDVDSRPLAELDDGTWEEVTSCCDKQVAPSMIEAIEAAIEAGDSLGSSVETIVDGLPIGIGEPWFDGLEPALARALMAIPAARAVEFGRGVMASRMSGSEHNDMWRIEAGEPTLDSGADGALGGLSSGAALRIKLHFKPPSSIPQTQVTANIASGESEPLSIEGRHDPVLGPRAAPVVRAVCELVLGDLALRASQHR